LADIVTTNIMTTKLRQTKLNALSAKVLHRKSKFKYEVINGIVAILTIIVPILFIIAQYISKGTSSEGLVNIVSFIISIVLIVVAVLAMILKVGDKITIHKVGIKNNIYITNECDNLGNKSDEQLEWFYKYVTEIDNQDVDTFANVSDKTKRKTYREAMKEFSPGDYSITCPICNSSPWEYKSGNCQLCGNIKK
jgi:mobilome CxxCx(11)CxxC protein